VSTYHCPVMFRGYKMMGHLPSNCHRSTAPAWR